MILRRLLVGRRQVAAGLSATALSRYFGGVCAVDSPGGHGRMLLSLFSDPRRARALGADFARTLPASECSEEGLAAALLSELPGALDTTELLRKAVATRIQRDFIENRVVRVDGWILAETEARLCALAALAAPRRQA